MTLKAHERATIRRQYRIWRLTVDMTQDEVENAARKHYPEFGIHRFWSIENGLAFPTPSERKALSRVLKVADADLPAAPAVSEPGDQAVAS